MKTHRHPLSGRLCLSLSFSCLTAIALFGGGPVGAAEAEEIHGGLVVQIGAADLATPIRLSETGRHVVQVLDTDAATVAKAQKILQAKARYGLVSANLIDAGGALPFTENLVNMVLLNELIRGEGLSVTWLLLCWLTTLLLGAVFCLIAAGLYNRPTMIFAD